MSDTLRLARRDVVGKGLEDDWNKSYTFIFPYNERKIATDKSQEFIDAFC